MRHTFGTAAAIVALMVALMAAAVRVQAERERRYPSEAEVRDGLSITSGAVVRRLSLAYAPLAADLYWIRSLQVLRRDQAPARGGAGRGDAATGPGGRPRRSSIRCCIRSST